MLDFTPDVYPWAEQNFGAVDPGDPRRSRRMVDCAARIATHPEKSFPQILDWNQLRAFYRLRDQQKATLQGIQQPHWEATRLAMSELPVALIGHDTTELDFTSHHAGDDGDGRADEAEARRVRSLLGVGSLSQRGEERL